MEPSAQTQNFAASSGFLPLALATKAPSPKAHSQMDEATEDQQQEFYSAMQFDALL
jgi:hypothetical protein